MKNESIAVTDAGPIISLAIIDRLDILEKIFAEVFIPSAVSEELYNLPITNDIRAMKIFIKEKVKKISGENCLLPFVDYGESEAILLCKEIKADYLIIDDKKARNIAEEFGVDCIGTIGILYRAKDKKIIRELRPLFMKLIENKRYYSRDILNNILYKTKEKMI